MLPRSLMGVKAGIKTRPLCGSKAMQTQQTRTCVSLTIFIDVHIKTCVRKYIILGLRKKADYGMHHKKIIEDKSHAKKFSPRGKRSWCQFLV